VTTGSAAASAGLASESVSSPFVALTVVFALLFGIAACALGVICWLRGRCFATTKRVSRFPRVRSTSSRKRVGIVEVRGRAHHKIGDLTDADIEVRSHVIGESDSKEENI